MIKEFDYLRKNSLPIQAAKKDIEVLPENLVICDELLKLVDNKKTKVKLDEDIKNSYYIFLNDTIYISDKEKNKRNFQRILLLCHEVIHSIQNKKMQKINFIFSNLEIILFFITIFVSFFIKLKFLLYIYIFVCLTAICARLYLEVNAVQNSLKLCKKFLSNILESYNVTNILNIYKFRIKLIYPLFIFNLVIWRIIRIILCAFIVAF